MSSHHPDDMTLMEYSAGSLALPRALAVSLHLFFCGHCREQLKQLDQLGGAMLEQAQPASVAEDDFERLMARIDSAPTEAHTPESKPARSGAAMQNPLDPYLPDEPEKLPWHRQTREIGVYDLSGLISARGFKVALQKIRAGARVPTHTHRGREITVILSGGFSDELGVYRAGDYIERDASHHHSPRAMENEDCICLTVLDAPLQFTQGLYRLLNPFMAWR